MRQSISGLILALAALAILGSAALHGIVNVPHLHEDMIEIGTRPTLLGAVTLVLYFSVVAMFAFGGLVLSGAVQSFRGGSPQLAPLWVVAVSYTTFGIAAFVLVGPSPHFLGYAAMGLLVALGAALGRARALRG
ncbi:MAG TPA: hypothetical protein VMW27_12070 [Thermoanaerobaculia bacterium]|nr:hypothetical protein [Thermoanaerobaculia bacterium]